MARGLHQFMSEVYRAAWAQAGNPNVPTDFTLDGNEADAEAFLTALNMLSTTLSYGSAMDEMNTNFADLDLSMTKDEWQFMMDRAFEIMDHAFERLSDYGQGQLGPALGEIRSMLGDLTYSGANTVAAGQAIAGQFMGMYKDWEFVRLARTEMASAWEVGRHELFKSMLGADNQHILAAADQFGLKFEGAPIHPNCNCTTDVVEGADGAIYEFLHPGPAACSECQDVADWILQQIPFDEPYEPAEGEGGVGAPPEAEDAPQGEEMLWGEDPAVEGQWWSQLQSMEHEEIAILLEEQGLVRYWQDFDARGLSLQAERQLADALLEMNARLPRLLDGDKITVTSVNAQYYEDYGGTAGRPITWNQAQLDLVVNRDALTEAAVYGKPGDYVVPGYRGLIYREFGEAMYDRFPEYQNAMKGWADTQISSVTQMSQYARGGYREVSGEAMSAMLSDVSERIPDRDGFKACLPHWAFAPVAPPADTRSGSTAEPIELDEWSLDRMTDIYELKPEIEANKELIYNPSVDLNAPASTKVEIMQKMTGRLEGSAEWDEYMKRRIHSSGMSDEEWARWKQERPDSYRAFCEQEVRDRISCWAADSGDSDPAAVAMQIAIQREFGLSDADVGHFGGGMTDFMRRVLEDLDADGGIKSKAYQSFVREMYKNTQEWLEERGITEILLFRGVRDPAVSRLTVAGEGAFGEVQLQPASSFSTNPDTAFGFGSTVMVARIPAKNIIGTARSGFGCRGEFEVVVLGNRQMSFVYRAKAGSGGNRDNLLYELATKSEAREAAGAPSGPRSTEGASADLERIEGQSELSPSLELPEGAHLEMKIANATNNSDFAAIILDQWPDADLSKLNPGMDIDLMAKVVYEALMKTDDKWSVDTEKFAQLIGI